MLFALRMLLLSDRLVCTTNICMHVDAVCFAHGLFSDGLFFTNNVRCSFDNLSVGWTLQRRRRRIQRRRLIQRCCLSSQVLSPAHLQPGISECRGDSGGGFGYVYTFLPRTFIVVLVGVLVSCVPIPTSHYSVPFSRSTFSLAALSWEKG